MNPPDYTSLPDHFWSKVEVAPSGCWLWTASSRREGGYGSFGVSGKVLYAHRLALTDFDGSPYMSDLLALHHCDIPPCVRAAHLYWGTKHDNAADMMRRGRNVVMAGEANGEAKLTDAKVLKIRQLYAADKGTHRSLAAQFGVAKSSVGRILRRTHWKHL